VIRATATVFACAEIDAESAPSAFLAGLEAVAPPLGREQYRGAASTGYCFD
jgi:hypothetical protein